jgi:GTP-binding protein Era
MSDMLAQQAALVQPPNPHAANVVILGTPNAGKSTLVNRLVGQKISAVSHKRNTTRTSVLGVATKDNRQLVLFDTPGVLPKLMSNKYQKELSTAAWDAAQGADVAIVIVDAVKRLTQAEFELFEKVRQRDRRQNPRQRARLSLVHRAHSADCFVSPDPGQTPR